jgi:hypothetical protein
MFHVRDAQRRFSPNAFKEEHTVNTKPKGHGNWNAVRMLLLSREEETGKLEKIVPGLTLGFKKIQKVYVRLCISKFVAHASIVYLLYQAYAGIQKQVCATAIALFHLFWNREYVLLLREIGRQERDENKQEVTTQTPNRKKLKKELCGLIIP